MERGRGSCIVLVRVIRLCGETVVSQGEGGGKRGEGEGEKRGNDAREREELGDIVRILREMTREVSVRRIM